MESSNRITLTKVGEVVTTEKGTTFFRASFKKGALGKNVSRTFYARKQSDGSLLWERAAPEDLKGLVGKDLTGEVSIEAVETEPHEMTIEATGEVITMTNRTIVRFADENVEQAASRYGVRIREEAAPVGPVLTLLPSRNGHGELV